MRLYLTSLYTQQINDKLICYRNRLLTKRFPFLTLITRFTESSASYDTIPSQRIHMCGGKYSRYLCLCETFCQQFATTTHKTDFNSIKPIALMNISIKRNLCEDLQKSQSHEKWLALNHNFTIT